MNYIVYIYINISFNNEAHNIISRPCLLLVVGGYEGKYLYSSYISCSWSLQWLGACQFTVQYHHHQNTITAVLAKNICAPLL